MIDCSSNTNYVKPKKSPIFFSICSATLKRNIFRNRINVFRKVNVVSHYVAFWLLTVTAFLLWGIECVFCAIMSKCLLLVAGLTLSQASTALISHSESVWKAWTDFLHSSLVCHFWLNRLAQENCGVRMYASW